MKKFIVSVQIGFYSEPYAFYDVFAYDERSALAKVYSMIPKHVGHRFLNVVKS